MPLTYTPSSEDALSFTVDFDRFDCEDFASGQGRWQYTCTITVDGESIDAGPIRSGRTTQDNPDGLGSMLGGFLSFFSAFIDAKEGDENWDLFPSSCYAVSEKLDGGQVALWADEVRRAI